MERKLGLYIHIPFCKAKCHYCDFNSYPHKEALFEPYFKALETEIIQWAGRIGNRAVGTVFIGGGTPSLVDESYITCLMESLKRNYNIEKNAEITIESNPGTLSACKLDAYRSAGVNRLSIGLQAWQDRLLRKLGRIHDSKQFVGNYESAVSAGFENINVDLIFGLPEQTLADWQDTVFNVAGLRPAHISCYSLKIEEGTDFGKELEDGLLTPVDDQLDREMYHFAIERLKQCGYGHYEISNFARPGFECRHNLVYWKADEYIGIGAGAHSYIGGERFSNTCGVEDYVLKLANWNETREDIIIIDKKESMSEFMLLGFRKTDGVDALEFRERYGEDMHELFGKQLIDLTARGLILRDGESFRLTEIGLDLANQVFMEFV